MGDLTEDDPMRVLLRAHWLMSMECLHVIRSDVAHCACGWKSTIQPSVGSAVERWIDHLAEQQEEGRNG